jgi:hypothetical protein
MPVVRRKRGTLSRKDVIGGAIRHVRRIRGFRWRRALSRLP